MAAITPSTNLRLLKNTNNLSNQNQLTFANATAQYNYFNSLTKLVVEDFTYQRKDYVIRYNACIDDILDYNYVMYQNEAYGNKWFYAYITNMRYLNDNVTEITIQTDVFQTFQFDITFKTCFVAREHVSDDTLGYHTMPEGLETGEYVINSYETDNLGSTLTIVMATTVDPNDKILRVGKYNGIPAGVGYYRYDNMGTPSSPESNSLLYAINQLNQGYEGAIVGMFLAPTWLFSNTNIPVSNSDTPSTSSFYLSRITNLSGYVPKNNKCLCFPYCFIEVSNGIGQANTYYQELWSPVTSGLLFKIDGCLTPGCSIRGYPCNYKGAANNYDEGISLGKYPQLNWNTDHYTNWLVQNGVNLGITTLNAEQSAVINAVGNAALGVGELAMGNPMGANELYDSATGIFGFMQEKYRHSLVPPTLNGSLNNGDVITSSGLNKFHFYKKTIKYEYAVAIDNYFSMYGYQVNSVKVPNITGRTYWNYVKTVGANIEGLIPEYYMNEIKGLFNAGITLWHDPTHFLDYSQNNTIVTP